MLQRYDFYLSCASVWEKSDDLAGVFNSYWVLGLAKCSIYKPKWVDYKLYWRMWMDDINFVASMSAGRILKSPIVKRVRKGKKRIKVL